jgi:hypothetical protein
MLKRHLEPVLSEALADTPVVLLNGARQTGKSTLVQALAAAQGRRYLTLDDRVALAAVRDDPAGFVAGLQGPVALDEVQRAPELFLDLKAAVDRDRQPGRFLLTGSANVLLLPGLADTLAGRMEVLTLWPLSSAELQGQVGLNRAEALFDGATELVEPQPCDRAILADTLLKGGFPEVVARSTHRRRAAWLDAYVETVLQRDVRDLAQLDQLSELPHLLELLAARSGGQLNLAELSRSTRLPQTTLRRYFALLQTLFLVNLGQFCVHNTWVLYTGYRFAWKPIHVGLSLAVVGITAAVVQGGLSRIIIPAVGERRALVWGLLLNAMTLGLYGLATRGWMIYAVLPFGAVSGIGPQAGQGIVSRSVGPDEQGAVQGALAGLNSVAAFVAPLVATNLFGYFIGPSAPMHLPGIPFFLAATLVTAGLTVAVVTLQRHPVKGV